MVSKVSKPFSLLNPATPGQYGPREGRIATSSDWWMVEAIVAGIDGVVSLDFETKGVNTRASDFKVVGIGIGGKNLEEAIYFSLKNGENPRDLVKALCGRELLAFNAIFEGLVLERLCQDYGLPSIMSEKWPLKWDARSMYFHLSQHEWPQQRYKLKESQVDVLGWEDKGDVELDEWLISNGYVDKSGNAAKGEMWRVPDEILGKYCCMDVQSTYQLYTHLLPQLQKFPDAVDFISNVEVPYQYRAFAEMTLAGMKIDEVKMRKLKAELEAKSESFKKDFLNIPVVTAWSKKVNEEKIAEINVPPKYKKDGTVTKRFINYEAKVAEMTPYEWFNPNSKLQMRDLFYNYIYSIGEIKAVKNFRGEHRQNKKGEYFFEVEVYIDDETYIHEFKSRLQEPDIKSVSIDKDILPRLGDAGKAVKEHNYNTKLLGYIEGMLNSLENGIHHGSLLPLGTMTGRAAGVGGVNLQQIPKDERYLECFVAREGHSLVDADVTALEPGVTCELSGCPSYNEIYNSGKKNDVYLYILAKTDEFGDTVRGWGYDPSDPDPDVIDWIKDAHKNTRGIGKLLQLMIGYKAGGKAIYRKLVNNGVDTTLEKANALKDAYWSPAIFGKVKEWEENLKNERKNNKGWIMDGLGLPITIANYKESDILNSMTQSTGHRILVKHIANVMRLRDERKVPFKFWIADIHDQITVEALDKDIPDVLKLFNDAEVITNEQLGGSVYFKIEPEVAKNFVPFKL